MKFGMEERWVKAVIWVIVIAFLTTIFAVWGAQFYHRRLNDPIAAVVNGDEILKREYAGLVDRQIDRFKKNYNQDINDTVMSTIKSNVLDDLIQDKLLNQKADDLKFQVLDEEVVRAIRSDQMFRNPDGTINLQKFERAKRQASARRWKSWETQIAHNLKLQKVRNAVLDKINVTPEEVALYYAASNMQAEISQILIDPTKYITDKESKVFFDDHHDSFVKPQKRRVSSILISDTDPSNDTPGSIERIKIDNIYRRLTKGDSFDVLAEGYSDQSMTFNHETKKVLTKGDKGYITINSNEYDKYFLFAAFSLKLYGISDVIRTTKGYEIIQVTDISDTEYYDYDEVKNTIKYYIVSDTNIETAKAEAADIIKEIKEKKLTFKQAAKKYSDGESGDTEEGYLGFIPRNEIPFTFLYSDKSKYVKSEIPIDKSDNKYYLSSNFSDSVFNLNVGEISNVILSKKGVHIVKLHSIKIPSNDDFNIEYDNYKSEYLNIKRNALFSTWYKNYKNSPDVDIEIRVDTMPVSTESKTDKTNSKKEPNNA